MPIDDANEKENAKCINNDSAIRDKVLITNRDVDNKSKDKHIGPFPILLVHITGTVRILNGCIP